MRHDHTPFKTRHEWSRELKECLEDARRRWDQAPPDQRPAARAHYSLILSQFNEFTITGRLPPEIPCFE